MQNVNLKTDKWGYPEYTNSRRLAEIRRVDFRRSLAAPKKNTLPKKAAAAALFWCIAMSLALAVNTKSFLDPVYINRIQNKNLNFSTEKIYAPTLSYLNNLNFFGENLMSPVTKSTKGKMLTINSSGEMTSLKSCIENILAKYKHLHAGVYVFDYSTGKTVEINSEEIFPSASIIKIPVLLDLFNRSKLLKDDDLPPVDLNKELTFTEADRTEGSGYLQFNAAGSKYTIDYLASIMIRQSDNSATNMLIEENGGINETNASLRRFGFTKTQVSNWLPDLKGTNTTTPKDVATMLYNIDNRKLFTTASSANIKEYLSKVENRTLIRSQIPDSAVLMHKTGDIGSMLGDAGIVFTQNGKKFILAIMVKRPHNDYSARDLIQKVSKVVYNTLG